MGKNNEDKRVGFFLPHLSRRVFSILKSSIFSQIFLFSDYFETSERKIIDIKKYTSASRQSMEDLRKEAQIMMGLDHPNIVKVVDTFQTEATMYIVMQMM